MKKLMMTLCITLFSFVQRLSVNKDLEIAKNLNNTNILTSLNINLVFNFYHWIFFFNCFSLQICFIVFIYFIVLISLKSCLFTYYLHFHMTYVLCALVSWCLTVGTSADLSGCQSHLNDSMKRAIKMKLYWLIDVFISLYYNLTVHYPPLSIQQTHFY